MRDSGSPPSDGSAPIAPPAGSVIVGYYPAGATYSRDFQVSEIPAAGLTHINYAGVFISYDDPGSLAKKAAYARSAGLRGTMIWDLSSDTSDHALLSALAAP
jgi:GH18 family chitinase